MKRIISALVFGCSLLIPVQTAGDEAVVLLAVTPGFDYAPVAATYKVTVPPHKDNIWMCWGFFREDSVIYARKSCEQLNGIYSAKVHWFTYKDLPKGEYNAWVQVYRVPYRMAGEAKAMFRVLPSLGG